MPKKLQIRNGFTLVEVLFALTIAAFVFTWAASLYFNVLTGSEKVQLERELYANGRGTLERLVNEFRTGTVDYAEYWNQSRGSHESCGSYIGYDVNADGNTGGYEQERYSSTDSMYEDDYGQCFLHYEASFWKYGIIGDLDNHADAVLSKKVNKFYQENNDNDYAVDADVRPNAIGDYVDFDGDGQDDKWQEELYLINAEGNEKTIIRRRTNLGNKCYGVAEQTLSELRDNSVAISDLEYCQIEMLKMTGADTDQDGRVDTWSNASGYESGFEVISSPDIDVVDLRFFISPVDDPNLAYDEDLTEQIHPHVTIIYSAQVNPQQTALIEGAFPQMTVQTTVGSRIYYGTD